MNFLRMSLLFAFCAAALQTEAAHGTSIDIPPTDCTKPKDALDTRICADKAMKEWWVDELYEDALSLNPRRRDAINTARKEWIILRDQCADPDGTMACAYALYDERINAVIKGNIQPFWLRSADNPAQALGDFRPLSSPLAKMYADLLTHALSDESVTAFSAFAEGLAGQFDTEVWKNGPAVVLPCALVEKYPRLLLVLRPAFDGARDTDRIQPAMDCEWDPVPESVRDFLKNNRRALENWFERCGGESTVYRPWAKYSFVVGDRMRYFPRSYVTDRLAAIDAPDKPWPTPQEIETWYSDPDYRKAQVVLGTYYLLHFRLAPEESELAAARALWDGRNTMANPTACLGAP